MEYFDNFLKMISKLNKNTNNIKYTQNDTQFKATYSNVSAMHTIIINKETKVIIMRNDCCKKYKSTTRQLFVSEDSKICKKYKCKNENYCYYHRCAIDGCKKNKFYDNMHCEAHKCKSERRDE